MFETAPAPKPMASDSLHTALIDRFRQVAVDPAGHFEYPTGEDGLRGLGYDPAPWASLPTEVLRCYCGVGNPFLPGLPGPSDSILDIGSGAGVDSLIAALCAPKGQVDGIELCPEMVQRAKSNAELSGIGNARFQSCDATALPFPDASFDLVISNGVFNLVTDKNAALAEVFRVLKPGGGLQVADQIRTGDMPQSCSLDRGQSWAR